MGSFSPTSKSTMLNSITYAYASLHNGDPGTTGANEISGGTPAYARKAITVGASSAGSARTLSADVTFDVPAGTITHVGYWSAITGGTFQGSDPVTSETFAAQGQYKLLASGTNFAIND
jgi:hypothetical protein